MKALRGTEIICAYRQLSECELNLVLHTIIATPTNEAQPSRLYNETKAKVI